MNTLELKNPVTGQKRHGLMNVPHNAKAVMIIVHGFGEHCQRYENMMNHFGAHGFASITADLTGHGRSEGKWGVCRDYEILRADVDMLMTAAEEIAPKNPTFLYGHSMGGGLVLNYMLSRKPDNIAGVISSAPLIESAIPVPKLLFGFIKRVRGLMPNATMPQKIDGDKVNSRLEAQKEYEDDPLNHDKLGTGLGIDIIDGGAWVSEQASQWHWPLLLMHARKDQLTSFKASEAFAAKAQNCTFIPFENCEHEIHNDVTREAVYTSMAEFMESHI